MNLSDTIRRAALGPSPKTRFRPVIGNWIGYPTRAFHEVVWAYINGGGTSEEWLNAPEEVQRMFLLFCAEDCES